MLGTMGRRRKEPDTSTYAGRLAARIRELRMAKGWTQGDLAQEVGRTITVVSGWETLERQPRIDDLPIIAAALGKTVSALMPRP